MSVILPFLHLDISLQWVLRALRDIHNDRDGFTFIGCLNRVSFWENWFSVTIELNGPAASGL